MKNALKSFFQSENIELFEVLPFEKCDVTNQALLSRTLPDARSAILYALPYFTAEEERGNISLYARSLDYHTLIKRVNERLISLLLALLPHERFAGFGDHSPIDERTACARAGLGILGDNSLLITKKYGSFVFLGEVLTTAPPEIFPAAVPREIPECLHCGACKRACPCSFEGCASGISQKKGELTSGEEELLLKTGLIWGCDLCQTCCPLNKNAEKTPIDFFYSSRIAFLDKNILESLDKAAFLSRAFSWRGRAPLYRNIELFLKHEKGD